MSSLSDCFAKHSFEDFNNIDFDILYNAVHFQLDFHKKNNSENGFFDIGTNCGSFVKV